MPITPETPISRDLSGGHPLDRSVSPSDRTLAGDRASAGDRALASAARAERPVGVRKATAGDAAALSELAATTFPLACPPDTSLENIREFIDRHLSQTSFAGYLADPARVILLAEEDATPIGYAMLVFADPADPDVAAAITRRPTAELSKLYVLPGHHGSGVAHSLIAASIGVAKARGAAAMWLGVNQQNARANRFYEKSGFLRVGTKTFLVGTRREDDFVRELLF